MSRPQPPIRDVAAIISALRRDGAAYWPLGELPTDFLEWRRQVRRAAKAANLRVSVRRGEQYVFVEHLDHEETEDELYAVADVLDATFRGERLSFDGAVRARARARLRVVEP